MFLLIITETTAGLSLCHWWGQLVLGGIDNQPILPFKNKDWISLGVRSRCQPRRKLGLSSRGWPGCWVGASSWSSEEVKVLGSLKTSPKVTLDQAWNWLDASRLGAVSQGLAKRDQRAGWQGTLSPRKETPGNCQSLNQAGSNPLKKGLAGG